MQRFLTTSDVIAHVERLGLPEVFKDIVKGEPPEPFVDSCASPDISLMTDLDGRTVSDHVSGLTGLCPLWECNGDYVVGVLPDMRYVRFYFEDAAQKATKENISVLGENYQQFAASVLDDFAQWASDDELVIAAARLEFRDFARYKKLVDDCEETTWSQVWEEYLKSLS